MMYDREVGPRHSSCEANEQSRATGCGVGGAKGGGRGECESAKHGPGTGPGNRVTGAGAHTASRKAKEEGELFFWQNRIGAMADHRHHGESEHDHGNVAMPAMPGSALNNAIPTGRGAES